MLFPCLRPSKANTCIMPPRRADIRKYGLLRLRGDQVPNRIAIIMSGNGMMLNALYSAMDEIIAMKRNTCAKAVYVGNAKPR